MIQYAVLALSILIISGQAPVTQASPTTEEAFVKAIAESVRTEFRASLLFSDYYIACLENDQDWFLKNGAQNAAAQQKNCDTFLDPIREGIKDRYSEMRLLMGIAQKIQYGDAVPYLPELDGNELEPLFDESIPHFRYNSEKKIAHSLFDGIPQAPLSKAEQHEAEILLFHDRIAHAKAVKGFYDPRLAPMPECADEALATRLFLIPKDCYEERYRRLILGDPNTGLEAIPLLLYVSSENPSTESLINGIRMIRQNTSQLLAKLESQYFHLSSEGRGEVRSDIDLSVDSNKTLFRNDLTIQMLIDASKKLHPDWSAIYKRIQKRISHEETVHQYLEIAGLVVLSVGCNVFFKIKLHKRLCETPLTLGSSVIFYAIDSKKLESVIRRGLYRADSARVLSSEINNLNDHEFAKKITSAALIIFGVGTSRFGFGN